MNAIKNWLIGLMGGIGFMGMFINFPLWSDNIAGCTLAIIMTIVSIVALYFSSRKEEKEEYNKSK